MQEAWSYVQQLPRESQPYSSEAVSLYPFLLIAVRASAPTVEILVMSIAVALFATKLDTRMLIVLTKILLSVSPRTQDLRLRPLLSKSLSPLPLLPLLLLLLLLRLRRLPLLGSF